MFKGTIRELREEDAEQVQKIFEQYWTDEGFLEKLKNRLKQFVEHSPEILEQDYKYFVAEENREVVGIGVTRKAPDKMKKYATTDSPVELYVLASKYKRRGIGTALFSRFLEEIKNTYMEAIFYSPESHKESWNFHDQTGFERVGPTEVDGEPGCVWRKIL